MLSPSRFAIFATFAALSTPALAQQQPQQSSCAPMEQIEAKLAALHEAKAGAGVSRDGTLTTLYLAPGGETFTVVKITPSGLACAVDWGGDFQFVEMPKDEGQGT